jgi:glycosyltransferase involved in cell wall biosynthesis
VKQHTIAFILEQALGHVTHAHNLQSFVPCDTTVNPLWALIPYETHGLAAKLPVYKSNWTVRSGLRARRALRRLTAQSQVDALFFHTQVPAVLCNDYLHRYPSVVSLDATPMQYDALGVSYAHKPGPAWLEHYKWQLNRDCFRTARRVVAWSQWVADGLQEGYGIPREHIAVIPPGVGVQDWAHATEHSHTGPVKVLFVGGNLERKGGLLLLQAYRALKPLNVELHLVTRDRVPPEPGVYTYYDMQPNSAALKQLYWQSDIFCLPTQADCLALVLLEAGAVGLPMISTNIAAIPEVVHDGETGLLIPPNDLDGLVQALRRLVEDAELRTHLGHQARELVTQKYDAQKNAQVLLDLLKTVAEEGRP